MANDLITSEACADRAEQDDAGRFGNSGHTDYQILEVVVTTARQIGQTEEHRIAACFKCSGSQVGIDPCEETRQVSLVHVGAVVDVDIIRGTGDPAERDESGWQGNVVGDRACWGIGNASTVGTPEGYIP